ncbi:MAG: polyprenyl synthetase family protein [Proteobacteria bacterium]|nr:polyprenyl synthetase family protein [Pseudomonadota bacterium]
MADVIHLDGAAPRRASMEPLMQLVGDDLIKVNHTILDRMHSRAPLIPQLAGHIIASGGKRLRPMLTLAATRLCGYVGERQIGLAAAVEFIHTASLLHDDVVDASDLRRGDATANVLWGNQPSVLVGDFLFSRAFQIMVQDGSLEVLRVLANASAVISEGEVMQLETLNNVEIPEEKYLEVVTAKTAALFAAACRIGAVIAGRGTVVEDALENFGRNLGIAFQLVDDTLDYSAQQITLGKTVGDDFREGKVTLPVLLAYRRGDEAERTFWRRCIADGAQRDGDLDAAIEILQRHDALHDSIDRARHYGAMARDGLGIFPDGEAKRALIDVVDFCIERAY